MRTRAGSMTAKNSLESRFSDIDHIVLVGAEAVDDLLIYPLVAEKPHPACSGN